MTVKIRAARVLRAIARWHPFARRAVEKLYHRVQVDSGPGFIQRTGRHYTIISSPETADEQRVGIYLRGGCDLPAMYGVAKMMRPTVSGTCAILRDSIHITGSRSDILLQALDGVPHEAEDAAREVVRRLRLPAAYFSARPFAPSFQIPRERGASFPKSVVVFSAGADFTRAVYRHREYGFLVDPGGFWLSNSIEAAMASAEDVSWFAKEYRSVGRMTVEEFQKSFGRLVTEVRERTGAHVLVFNTMTINPHDGTHSYSLVKQPEVARRRSFVIALAEMSNRLDFDIIDVDRVLKEGGVQTEVDFAHFSERQFEPIAAEALRVLRDRALI